MALTSKSTKVARFFNQRFQLPEALPLTAEAVERAAELSKAAKAVAKVTTAEQFEQAVDAGRDIQSHVKGVEAFGLDFRRPIKAFTDMVKKTQDDYLAPLLAEQDRLKRLVGDFQSAEARRVAKEEQERREAFEAAEKERLRLEAEANAKLAKAQESGGKRDEKAAVKAAELAEEAELAVQAVIAAPAPQAARAAGSSSRQVLKWEVTDLKSLYAARPELCKVEVKASAVQACCVPESPVPGLKLWWETPVSFTKR